MRGGPTDKMQIQKMIKNGIDEGVEHCLDPAENKKNMRIMRSHYIKRRLAEAQKRFKKKWKDCTEEEKRVVLDQNSEQAIKRLQNTHDFLKSEVRRLKIIHGETDYNIYTKLGILPGVYHRILKEVKQDLKLAYLQKQQNQNAEIITQMHERYEARNAGLYNELETGLKKNEIARVLAYKTMNESDRDHAKFLQSVGILRNETPNNIEILLDLNGLGRPAPAPLSNLTSGAIVDINAVQDARNSEDKEKPKKPGNKRI